MLRCPNDDAAWIASFVVDPEGPRHPLGAIAAPAAPGTMGPTSSAKRHLARSTHEGVTFASVDRARVSRIVEVERATRGCNDESSSMRDSDAFAWYMETDPTLRATIVAVAWLEQSPDWDALVERLDRATRLIPMFRQRVVESPGALTAPGGPTTSASTSRWHLRRIDSPAPHTPETVIAIARNAAMTAFDHAHPLWEFTLVEHLEGGRAALVMKVHHALTDGIGGMQLALSSSTSNAIRRARAC